jgi:SAM-dependent methyltransferase
VKKEGLTNVTVIEGAEAATNLPDACCDAIFLRNVYHHITAVDAFNRSLVASLKPGGRLAIIDLEDRSGGQIPKGVPGQSRRTWRPAGHRGRRTRGSGPHSHQNGRKMAARGTDLSRAVPKIVSLRRKPAQSKRDASIPMSDGSRLYLAHS